MRNRLLKVIVFNTLLFLFFIAYYYFSKFIGIGIPCMFHLLTGYLCPGCGTTRLLFSLLELKIYDAFCYNRLVFIYLPFVIAYYIYFVYIYIFDKRDKIICKVPNVIWYILIFITIAFGFIRNIY